MKSLTSAIIFSLLTFGCMTGCGPSRSEIANAELQQLFEQAESQFQMGHLDEAKETIDQALAIKDATHRQEALALAEQINGKRRRRAVEPFNREAAKLLDKAAALYETDGPEAMMAMVAKSIPQASDVQRELALALLQRIQQATSWTNAYRYWDKHELTTLIDFREKDQLPEDWKSAVADDSPHRDVLCKLWRTTLRQALGEALAKAEIEDNRTVDPDHLLPSPTIEEVAADPKAWQGKEVQFDQVWIDGEVRVSKRRGWLLTVTSPAGEVYAPLIKQDALIFTTRGSVAKKLESFVAKNERVRARIFCKIERGRRTGPANVTSFYQAIIFKVELYAARDE